MNLEKELQEIGLQEKEARVYIAMLELGRATAQDIAKKADVNRATTYFVMENLMKKGLASAVDEGTKQYFLPEDPSQLEAIFEKKRIEFEAQKERVSALVSELSERNALKNKNPVVKYYLGKEGILRMAHSSFKYAKGEKLYTVFSKDELDKYISKEETAKARAKRVKNHMEAHALCNASENLVSEEGDVILRVPQEVCNFPGDISVYKDTIQFISYEDMLGIVIENKAIAMTIRSLFGLAFERAEEKFKTPNNEFSS
ncbi:MAG: hypothetical protein IPJ67_04820 [Candidatus Moraniibacteriota bacterium]|nr:MAG: hypothetical protein IPJ67_04820 [Candidatus Moranbacteria bacterium]